MFNGERMITIPRHNPVNAFTMGGIVQDAGLTVEDLLAELPAVREEILREDYGDEFVDELARRHAAVRGTPGDM